LPDLLAHENTIDSLGLDANDATGILLQTMRKKTD
jgi:hypothetical protein